MKNKGIKQARERLEKLKQAINKYRYQYHVLNKLEISEEVLDTLKKELFDLEQKYPELITLDSPTQRVEGKPLDKFKKVKHAFPMYSLNDAFSREDTHDWLKRLKNIGIKDVVEFYCDLKMDGLAVELVYENRIFVLGSTRGDGIIGEDVTQNLKTIDAIPLKLEDEPPRKLVVRGEVFLTKKEFERINKEQKKKGENIYANPRNIAAGSIRQLDPQVTQSRKLDFYAYAILGEIEKFPTKDKEYQALRKFGIKTNPQGRVFNSIEEIIKFQEKWSKERDKLDYEIDGLVVSINDKKIFEKAGVVGKSPRGAIAYKFSPKEATTKVKDIIVSVGRTGALTPIAILEPVEIGGVRIGRATLHNEDEIRRLDIKIGDTVIVGRAGDVIPDVSKVLKELRTGKEKEFRMPKACPVCGGKVIRREGEAAHRCINKNCPAIKRETIYHYAGKKAMDIVGVGPKIIDQLMDAGLIKNAPDLYALKKEDLLNLSRFAEKSAENTVSSIQGSKNPSLDKFIFALSIRHVGEETAFDLAKKFGSIQKLSSASLETLSKIPNIGEVVAESIYGWFRNKYNQNLLYKFKKAGVKPKEFKITKAMTKLARKTFVFTGSLESMTREDAQNKVRELGGDVSSDVSKSVDYVVAGLEPGTKYEKAKKLGIKIIDENKFLEMI